MRPEAGTTSTQGRHDLAYSGRRGPNHKVEEGTNAISFSGSHDPFPETGRRARTLEEGATLCTVVGATNNITRRQARPLLTRKARPTIVPVRKARPSLLRKAQPRTVPVRKARSGLWQVR